MFSCLLLQSAVCGAFFQRFLAVWTFFFWEEENTTQAALWPIIVKKKKKKKSENVWILQKVKEKVNSASCLRPAWLMSDNKYHFSNTLLRQKRSLVAHLTVFYSFKTNHSGFFLWLLGINSTYLRFPSLRTRSQLTSTSEYLSFEPINGTGPCSEAPGPRPSALRSRQEDQGAAAALDNS